jgi:hypothetical protein
MSLGVAAVAESSDDLNAHVGEGANDAPGIELSFVRHETLLGLSTG